MAGNEGAKPKAPKLGGFWESMFVIFRDGPWWVAILSPIWFLFVLLGWPILWVVYRVRYGKKEKPALLALTRREVVRADDKYGTALRTGETEEQRTARFLKEAREMVEASRLRAEAAQREMGKLEPERKIVSEEKIETVTRTRTRIHRVKYKE